MRIKGTKEGYIMWLSKKDTYAWAHRSSAAWPCATLAGKSVRVNVDGNGLYDITVNGYSGVGGDGAELDAVVSDYLPAEHQHLWPVWERSQHNAK